MYVSGGGWCGSGGCTLVVLEPIDSSYRAIGGMSIVRPPIRVLRSTTHGRHDLAVWVAGGGILPGYEALLRFDGKKYPSNPTMPPARRVTKPRPGIILITTEDRGELLFK